MKRFVLGLSIIAALSLAAAPAAEARGCFKGAVVGAVAGHFLHHHAVLGAVAGCAIGHHIAHEHDRDRHDRHDHN
jgi:hypothetical protein